MADNYLNTTRATTWAIAEQISAQGSSLLVFFVLARVIAPADYGVFSVAISVIAIINVVLYQGFGEAVIQRPDVDAVYLSTAFWSEIALAIILTAGIVLLSLVAAPLFDSPLVGSALRFLSVTCLLRAVVSVPLAAMRRLLSMKLYTLRTMLGGLASVLIGLGMAAQGYGIWALVGSQLAQAVVIAIVVWLGSPWRPLMLFSVPAFKDMAGFSRHLMLANVSASINERVNTVLIGASLDLVSVGYYSLSMRLLQAVRSLTTEPIWTLTSPVLSRLSKEPLNRSLVYNKMMIAATLASLPATLCMGMLAPRLIPLVFGPAWTGASDLLRVICLSALTAGLTALTGQALSAAGRPDLFSRLTLAQMAINFVGFAIAAHFGILVVGYTWLGITFAAMPVHLWLIRRTYGLMLWPLLADYLRLALASVLMLVMMGVVEALTAATMLTVMSEVAVAVTAYFAGVVLLMPKRLRNVVNFGP